VMQEMLEAEMTDALGAEKGERTVARLAYRSGYHTRTLVTRVGKLELRVPQDRDGRFSCRRVRQMKCARASLCWWNLRKLLVVGAHAVLFHRKSHTDPLRMWAKKLIDKKPFKLVAVALANKMARIAFAIVRGRTVYREIPA
jgi:hypothetical protein